MPARIAGFLAVLTAYCIGQQAAAADYFPVSVTSVSATLIRDKPKDLKIVATARYNDGNFKDSRLERRNGNIADNKVTVLEYNFVSTSVAGIAVVQPTTASAERVINDIKLKYPNVTQVRVYNGNTQSVMAVISK